MNEQLFNPYLDAVESWFEPLPGGTVGDAAIDEQVLINLRQNLALAFAWGIPDWKALVTIGAAGPVLEIGAGTAYWSWCLEQLDVDVLPVDIKQPVSNRRFTDVHEADAADVAGDHPDRTLFICWVSFPSTWAFEAVERFEAAGGDRVAAVMCDPVDFVEQSYPGSWMEYLDNEWGRAHVQSIPQWPQETDRLYVYER